MSNFKKGDILYVVYFNNGEIERSNSIKNLFRQDVKLVFKRTFQKHSSGQGQYRYFKNQILDKNFNVVRNNSFKWNGLMCKIKKDEHWASIIKDGRSKSVFIEIEVKDHLNRKNIYRYNMMTPHILNKLKDDLELIDRVGTHQGAIEITQLNKKISKLESIK